MELSFVSHTGDRPVFFVPDTGTPGGTAVIYGPGNTDGTPVVDNGTDENGIPDVQLDPTVYEWPALGFSAPRMGFRVPAPLVKGTHTLVVTQDGEAGTTVVDTYTIEVTDQEG